MTHPSHGSFVDGYMVVPRILVCNNTVFMLASAKASRMSVNSFFCFSIEYLSLACMLGQSSPPSVVSQTARTSYFGMQGLTSLLEAWIFVNAISNAATMVAKRGRLVAYVCLFAVRGIIISAKLYYFFVYHKLIPYLCM